MNIVDSLGIAAFLFVVFAEVVWVGLALDEHIDGKVARRPPRGLP